MTHHAALLLLAGLPAAQATWECRYRSTTCTNVAQDCVDPSWARGDWECRCRDPTTGPPQQRAPAVCLDPPGDCQVYGRICHDAGQTCYAGDHAGEPMARYVRVDMPGTYATLILCEVEVFSGGKNVAFQKAATSSRVPQGVPGPGFGAASVAVDGKKDSRMEVDGCTETANTNDAWWEVDLGEAYPVSSITIYNRRDRYQGYQLRGFVLTLLDTSRRQIATEVLNANKKQSFDWETRNPEFDGHFECHCTPPSVGVQLPSCIGEAYEINTPLKPFEALNCDSFTFRDTPSVSGCSCDTVIKGAYVEIENPTYESDVDTLTCTKCGGIASSFHATLAGAAGSGVLSLTGAFTLRQYAEAIASVEFMTPSTKGTDRRLTYNFGHGEYSEGHYYAFFDKETIPDVTKSHWVNSQTFCADRGNDILGLAGYLVTFGSQHEFDAMKTKVIADTSMYIAATDLGEEKTFRWVTGPEGCPDTYDLSVNGPQRTSCDLYPITDVNRYWVPPKCGGSNCKGGTVISVGRDCKQSDGICPWATPSEPNNWRLMEDFLHLTAYVHGGWNDVANYNIGAMCEWGGVGEACLEEMHGSVCLTLHKAGTGVSGQNGPAVCELDECLIKCESCAQTDASPENVCRAEGQHCDDPDKSAASTHDWTCNCGAPYEGEAAGRPVPKCTINECTADCDHCAASGGTPNVCTAAGQVCKESSVEIMHDWQCECVPPQSGAPAVTKQTTCTLDECVVNEAICTAAGQTCRDPNTAVNATGDWECRCNLPSHTVAVAAAAAVCIVDECERQDALHHWKVCDEANQVCADYKLDSLGDWECHCRAPAAGVAVAHQVDTCVLDECAEMCASCADIGSGSVCEAAGQDCEDPVQTTKSPGDWTCICKNEAAIGRAAAAASCDYNECTGVSSAALSCKDVPRYTVDGCLCACDWINGGNPCAAGCCDVGGASSCQLADDAFNRDASRPQCSVGIMQACRVWSDVPAGAPAPPESNVCTHAGQACVDNDQASADDWHCECVLPQTGLAGRVKDLAQCALDECALHKAVCVNAKQTCDDPNPSPDATDDWTCMCTPPAPANPTARGPAACDIDECKYARDANCPTCAGVNGAACTAAPGHQVCNDPNVTEGSLGDWVCLCVAPQVGEQRYGAAVCTLDECMVEDPACVTKGIACNACETAAPKQTCNDPDKNPSSTADWTCTCPLPSTTVETALAAVCRFDECSVADRCPAGQKCEEPSQTKDGDWVCRCEAPYTGSKVAGHADCEHNECDTHGATCTHEGQACDDPDFKKDGDWVCKCVDPDVGTDGQQQKAECETSKECEDHGPECAAVGQHCVDPDTNAQNNWQCHCIGAYVGTPGEQGPASCTLNECDAVCATCQRHKNTDVKFCEDMAFPQDCEDPNLKVEGDWLCKCKAPATGAPATAAAAACALDECTAACGSCAQGACDGATPPQHCEDPDHGQNALEDWVCICPAPSLSKMTVGAVHPCRHDECTNSTKAAVCTAASQTCVDPNTDLSSLNDWVCHCGAPSTSAATAGAAVCRYDECHVSCGSCANATCTDAAQTCTEPDTSVKGDWYCACAAPTVGTKVGAAVPSSECMLDECNTLCTSCADTGAGNVCDLHGQTCTDPSQLSLSTGDWFCRCPAPYVNITNGTAPARCAVDECVEAYNGAVAGHVCGAEQACFDVSHTTVGDFACTCVPPRKGSKVAAAAECTLDECEVPANNKTCADAQQKCDDANLRVPGSWLCVCPAPSVGTGAAQAAVCQTDECELADVAAVCQDAMPAQDCTDTDNTTDSTWKCVCRSPAVGEANMREAVCNLDECVAQCRTCAGTTCTGAEQACIDMNTLISSPNDWVCTCAQPSVGQATAAKATCTLDECTTDGEVCRTTTPPQQCTDPDTSPASRHDWSCGCAPPTKGSKPLAVATCTLNECETMGATCTSVGQTCTDPNTSPASLGDWECRCVPPAPERATAEAAATCTYRGDCRLPTVESVCTSKGQHCVDDDKLENGVWRCECVFPATGTPRSNEATYCALDECTVDCATCASTTCSDASQDCVDASPDALSLNDWACRCRHPKEGAAQRKPAACTLDECIPNGNTCTEAGQTCFDPSNVQAGDWLCRCPAPATQEATATPAQCAVNECDANGMTCTNEGQTCSDPDRSLMSLNDWVCECPPPTTGSATAAVATCQYDECTVHGMTCTGQGQLCADKDNETEGSWWCVCATDASLEAQGKPATCVIDECTASCGTCAGSTCTGAGQACADADTAGGSLGDWSCECPAPTTTPPAKAAAAMCQNNECEGTTNGNSVCGRGQMCNDPNWDPATAGDWTCTCTEGVGHKQGGRATCHLDECGEPDNSHICTDVGQNCEDPNVEVGAKGDWACRCPLTLGEWAKDRAPGRPANCTPPPESECSIPAHKAVCTDAHQTCHDPDWHQKGDWRCECVLPATGAAGEQAASAVCVLDECNTTCASCSGDACSAQNQDCQDPNPTPDNVRDWVCVCRSPRVGSAVAEHAVCTLDECLTTCAHCANTGDGNVCAKAIQTCRDPNLDARSEKDWLCECRDPTAGSKTGGAAACTLDECDLHRDVCGAGADCGDPDTSALSTDDWVCTCVTPTVGSMQGAAPECVLNECLAEAVFKVCVDAGQTCVDADPSPPVRGDWECHCPNSPAVGKAQAAVCKLDECIDTCLTCATKNGVNTCAAQGQTCDDPTEDPSRTGDWTCACPGGSPKAVSGVAVCNIDECRQPSNYGAHTCRHTPRYTVGGCLCKCGWQDAALMNATGPGRDSSCNAGCCNPDRQATGEWCEIDPSETKPQCKVLTKDSCVGSVDKDPQHEHNVCTDASQHCVDPDTRAAAVADWRCECIAPEVGLPQTRGLAQCSNDECLTHGKTCTDAGQTCFDGTKSDGDWVCRCPQGAVGSAGKQAAADCEWVGECVQYAHVCEQVGQTCEDPDKKTAGNWVCSCKAPAQGASVQGAVAQCTLDECTADCSSCAGTTCTAAEQGCRDLSASPNDLGDWLCECTAAQGQGARQGGVADCMVDECALNGGANGVLCRDAGQACVDPDEHHLGGWTCVCSSPAIGTATAQVAACSLDECIVPSNHDTCSSAGQDCLDPNPQVLGDWRCECTDTAEFGVAAAATCTPAGWCAENGHLCITAGQKCHEGSCECIAPETGHAKKGGATKCVLDECTAVCATCADEGSGDICKKNEQDCQEGSTQRLIKGDWTCKCRMPATGSATRAVATCIVDECDPVHGPGRACKDVGQRCIDTSPLASSQGDWQCVCPSPQAGRGEAAVANCTLNECQAQGGVCAAKAQSCFDADTRATSVGDWQCECVSPAVGPPVVAGPATCVEQGECETAGQICEKNGQVCVDPTGSKVAGDWECRCVPPRTGANGRPATCELDECSMVCAECAQKPGDVHVCNAAGQECHDPNTAEWSTGDWRCVCDTADGAGAQVGGVATCEQDECGVAVNSMVCQSPAGGAQMCVDPDTKTKHDWECRCKPPYTGPAGSRGAATCGMDECSVDYSCDACAAGGTGQKNGNAVCGEHAQTCTDPHYSTDDDWMCICPYTHETRNGFPVAKCEPVGKCAAEGAVCMQNEQVCEEVDGDAWRCVCLPPASGAAEGGAAECHIDECAATCASCERGACSGAGQTCSDPDTAAGKLADWVCTCASGVGSKAGGPAMCLVDECDGLTECEAAGQTCVDADLTTRGTWQCTCRLPSTGVADLGVASCVLDECIQYSSTCAAAGQECKDMNTATASAGDWACQCVAPALGAPTLGGTATCMYKGACSDPAASKTCTDAGQKCIDADPADGEAFRCACVAPAEGAPAVKAPAKCVLNECTSICPTCAIPSSDARVDVCTVAEQYCEDPDTATAQDWTCKCYAPATASAALKPVESCRHDECEAMPAPPCAANGQACVDPAPFPRSTGDWQCRCSDGSSATGQLATCAVDECRTVAVCVEGGQQCVDTDTSPTSTMDWKCVCLGSGEGEKKGALAVCVYKDDDECATAPCGSGQYCTDPARGVAGDYECRCAPPRVGAVGKAAPTQCGLDECTGVCPTCAKQTAQAPNVCALAGQACTDPSTAVANDWFCECPSASGAVGERKTGAPVARCTLDECAVEENAAVCTAAGQDCIDADIAAIGSWGCRCRAPEVGSGTRSAAVCRRDECEETAVAATCTSAVPEQVCYDAHLTTYSDWTCLCVLPATGQAAMAKPADCALPDGHECHVAGNRNACLKAGQECVDPNWNVEGDWHCRCAAPAVSNWTGGDKVATCEGGCAAAPNRGACELLSECSWDGASGCVPLKRSGGDASDDDDGGWCWWCLLIAVLVLMCCSCVVGLLILKKRIHDGDEEMWKNNKLFNALEKDEELAFEMSREAPADAEKDYGTKACESSKALLDSQFLQSELRSEDVLDLSRATSL